MKEPDAGIIGAEAEDDVAVGWCEDCVTAHWDGWEGARVD